MLFNLIAVALVGAIAIIEPIFIIKAVKTGFIMGNKPEKVEIAPKTKPKEVEPSPEMKRAYKIMENINRYDGTPKGQEKINVE